MTAAMMFEDDGSTVASTSPASYDSTNKLEKTLKIKYSEGGKSGEVEYPITIINDIKEISMKTNPKTQYNVNDTLDKTGGEILVKRAVGEDSTVSLEDANVQVEGFDSTVENNNLSLTVKYTENGITKDTNYTVAVTDSVKSISIKTPPKQDYRYNEDLDVTGGVITVVSGSGSKDVNMTVDMVTGYVKTDLGEKELTVTYGGETTTYKVNVKDYVTGITVNPDTVTGEYNDTLADLIDDNTITYSVVYAKAGAQTDTLPESLLSAYDPTSTIAQELTVTYIDSDPDSASNGETFTALLNITLEDVITGIAINDKPDKLDYGYTESLDITGGTITVTRKSGKTEDIPFETAGVTITDTNGNPVDLTDVTLDNNNQATKTIKVSYDGFDDTFDVNVTNRITGIVMENTPKTNYYVDDSFDITTDGQTVGTILVTRENGDTESIKLDNPNVNITGFDSTQENTSLSLTVTYTENGITENTQYIVVTLQLLQSFP